MFQGLSGAFELFVLTVSSGQHSISNDCVFNVLMNCKIDVFHFFNCFLNDCLLKCGIAIVFPNPISAELLELGLYRVLLNQFLDLDLLNLGLLFSGTESCFIELSFCWWISTNLWNFIFVWGLVELTKGLAKDFFVFLLTVKKLFLFVFVLAHVLDSLESDQSRNGYLHGIWITFYHVFFS